MAKLNFQEKQAIEKLLGMSTGYVSDFSNRTFQLFIGDYFNIDIYDEKYSDNGDSKANRLRTLLQKESEYVVSNILEGLLEHQIALDAEDSNDMFSSRLKVNHEPIYEQVRKTINRLKSDTPVENIASIKPVENDSNFTLLAESVRKSIETGNPIEALDRLHTYTMRYARTLCDKHALAYTKDEPLHSVFGKYKNMLREKQLVTSEMTHKILGNATQILDKYNNVRNNESLAHDNELINDDEALLILNSVANLIKFVDAIEKGIYTNASISQNNSSQYDNLPF